MKINWVKDDPMRWRSGQYQKKNIEKPLFGMQQMGNGKWKMKNQKSKSNEPKRSETKQLENPEMQLLVTESSAQAEVCSLVRVPSTEYGVRSTTWYLAMREANWQTDTGHG